MRLPIFIFLCWSTLAAFAQTEGDSQPRPLAWDSDLKELTLTNNETSAPFDFSVTNVSKEEIVITGTQASCQCTVANLPAQPWILAPGSNGQIHVEVNVAGKTGTVSKSVTIYISNHPPDNLTVKVVIPPPPPMSDEVRIANQGISKTNAQAVFKGTCADCHLTPSRGRTGAYLYETLCGVCHEAGSRQATMVPNLHSLPNPTDYNYWRKTITDGKTNSLMPAFSVAQGGPLSEVQINSLAEYLARTISRNFSKPIDVKNFVTSNGVPLTNLGNPPLPIRAVPSARRLPTPPVKKALNAAPTIPASLPKSETNETGPLPAAQAK